MQITTQTKKQPSVATTERTDFQPSTYAVASLFPNSQPGRKTLYSPSERSQVCCDEKLSRSPVAKLTRAAESGRRTHHQPAAAQQPVHIARHLLLLCVSFCGPPVNRVHVQQPLALVASRPNERTADRKSTNRKSQIAKTPFAFGLLLSFPACLVLVLFGSCVRSGSRSAIVQYAPHTRCSRTPIFHTRYDMRRL